MSDPYVMSAVFAYMLVQTLTLFAVGGILTIENNKLRRRLRRLERGRAHAARITQ